jgi:hypothetical protein
MEELHITVVGQDIFKVVEEKFKLININPVNKVNRGMLGNLKLLTFDFSFEDGEAIEKRKIILSEIGKDYYRLFPMYKIGDWSNIIIFKPFLK